MLKFQNFTTNWKLNSRYTMQLIVMYRIKNNNYSNYPKNHQYRRMLLSLYYHFKHIFQNDIKHWKCQNIFPFNRIETKTDICILLGSKNIWILLFYSKWNEFRRIKPVSFCLNAKWILEAQWIKPSLIYQF